MKEGKVVIFTAVRMEARAVERTLGGMSGDAEVHVIGIRGKCLPAEDVVAGAKIFVMAGLAGGLDPALVVGDVVIEDAAKLVPAELGFRRGRIYMADRIVSTPAQKAELFAQTGAMAVDMEGEIVRRLAEKCGVPFIHVRAISDTAGDVLDPAVMGLVDEKGRARPTAIAGMILRRPGMAGQLKRLGRNSKIAGVELGKAIREVVGVILN